MRARIEIVLALILAALTIMTIAWPRWIELVTGWQPDGGNGEAERVVVVVFALVTIAVAILARRDWRIARRRRAEVDTAAS